MPKAPIGIERDLLYEVVGFLEGVEKADGRPLEERAGMWAGYLARRLRAQHIDVREVSALDEKEKP